MEIGAFAKIRAEKVGYLVRANDVDGPRWLEALTFEQFIPPYSLRSETHEQVYSKLEEALRSNLKRQDSVTGRKRSVILDVLADATLQREAIRNSMDLIKRFYL